MDAVPAADKLGVHPQADIKNRWILGHAGHSGLNAGAAEANQLITGSNRTVTGKIVDDWLRRRKIVNGPVPAVSPAGDGNGLFDRHRAHLPRAPQLVHLVTLTGLVQPGQRARALGKGHHLITKPVLSFVEEPRRFTSFLSSLGALLG